MKTRKGLTNVVSLHHRNIAIDVSDLHLYLPFYCRFPSIIGCFLSICGIRRLFPLLVHPPFSILIKYNPPGYCLYGFHIHCHSRGENLFFPWILGLKLSFSKFDALSKNSDFSYQNVTIHNVHTLFFRD